MPETISGGNTVFAEYIKVASLPLNERQKSFRNLSNEQKASFVKVQFALQFVKRPNLTKQQRDFFLESISNISADLYDKENPQKVALANKLGQETETKTFGLFPQKDAFEILEGLGAGKDEDVALLRKYGDLLKNGMKLRRKIAKEMPINDRADIWKVQLAYHLTTGNFSKVQNEFILEMLTSVSPDTFTPQMNLTAEEKSAINEKLLSNIFSVFTKQEGYAIFMAVGIQKYVKDSLEVNRGGSCNCNFYCSDDNLVCGESGGCESTLDGCGPWGSMGCHYKCQIP